MNLAIFDFDGTITNGDTFTPFLRFAIPATRAIAGGLLLGPVLVARRFRLISTPRTRSLVARVGFVGVPASGVRNLGRRYASEVLPLVVRAEAMKRLE